MVTPILEVSEMFFFVIKSADYPAHLGNMKLLITIKS
jgi:hypothetical protein